MLAVLSFTSIFKIWIFINTFFKSAGTDLTSFDETGFTWNRGLVSCQTYLFKLSKKILTSEDVRNRLDEPLQLYPFSCRLIIVADSAVCLIAASKLFWLTNPKILKHQVML